MAIRAHRTEMFDGIYLVALPDATKGNQVMHMNDAHAGGTVAMCKIEPANGTTKAMMPETGCSSCRRTLERVDRDSNKRSFQVLWRRDYFLGDKW
jgi:hypothetical protein